MQYESERIEYKSQMIDDIYKEVIAFANTDGGVIYLGIDDKGNQIGIDNVDETYSTYFQAVRKLSCTAHYRGNDQCFQNRTAEYECCQCCKRRCTGDNRQSHCSHHTPDENCDGLSGRVRRNDRRRSAGTVERQKDESLSARPSDE